MRDRGKKRKKYIKNPKVRGEAVRERYPQKKQAKTEAMSHVVTFSRYFALRWCSYKPQSPQQKLASKSDAHSPNVQQNSAPFHPPLSPCHIYPYLYAPTTTTTTPKPHTKIAIYIHTQPLNIPQLPLLTPTPTPGPPPPPPPPASTPPRTTSASRTPPTPRPIPPWEGWRGAALPCQLNPSRGLAPARGRGVFSLLVVV